MDRVAYEDEHSCVCFPFNLDLALIVSIGVILDLETYFISNLNSFYSWRDETKWHVAVIQLSHLFLFWRVPFFVSNGQPSVPAAGSNCPEPNSGGVIRRTGRSIWLHDWQRLMIIGCDSTLLWSTNHAGLAWTALNVNEPWLEYWKAACPHGSMPFTLWGIEHMMMAMTLQPLPHSD